MIPALPELKAYVQEALALYRHWTGPHVRPRTADRQLAATLHGRGITIKTLESAFLLTIARRTFRPPDRPKLNPIRSLHYFMPALEEILQNPLPPVYADFLRQAIQKQSDHLAAGKSPKNTSF